MVIWVTGLSGAGKTTLCREIHERLRLRLKNTVFLDGDAVRHIVNDNLGFTAADRCTQIGRIQRMAQMLSKQGLVVLVAALYTSKSLLAWNRENLPSYFEVFLDVPLEVVQARDPKKLYARAKVGEAENVVGLDIPFHRPENPDLISTPVPVDRIGAEAEHILQAALAAFAP